MTLRYIDLFCGIGGFHHAARAAGRSRGVEMTAVFASDLDAACRRAYQANFGMEPAGDITKIAADEIPAHDLLFAGFPCQPFSIIGGRKGFADDRGTLFFDIKRILAHHRPRAFVLENVKQLRGHDQGRTLTHILSVLRDDLGYATSWRILNALDFGLPQKRERIVIVGFRDGAEFSWPEGGVPMTPLKNVLEAHEKVAPGYFASERIRAARHAVHTPDDEPTIWHENKSGNISKLPYSCALRAGASYNYLLVDGLRRMTEREMLRLQGFPESHVVTGSYAETRKQAGNSVPVPMIEAVIARVIDAMTASPRPD